MSCVVPSAIASAPPSDFQANEDSHFSRLLGGSWALMPKTVQARFSQKFGPGQSVTYAGRVLSCRISHLGFLLAQACRLIGAPLPLFRDVNVAAVVTVTGDGGGGQVWTRLYARSRGFPQAIHSAKRFSGPTGLEEWLGGFGIALNVAPIASGIRFASDHYFFVLAGQRLRWPSLLSPGRLRVDHQDLGNGAFTFTLALDHPLFGALIAQKCLFHDQD